ncbi:hypothetical protein MMC11_000375 [Xylographa trunciseda]|nr:hypothetical protein [Xylographa trunciseda]
MADAPSSAEETLPVAESYVPIIDIDWIERILDGTHKLPMFQMGDEVCVVDDGLDRVFDHGLKPSSLDSPRLEHLEDDLDERKCNTTYQRIEDTYCKCELAPLFCYETGKYVSETKNFLMGHVHTELGPMTIYRCFLRQIELQKNALTATHEGRESPSEARHFTDVDGNIAVAGVESNDATHQAAMTENNEDRDPDAEGAASSISDDQWVDVLHLLPPREGESQTKLDSPVDAEPSVALSESVLLEKDHGTHTSENIDTTTTEDQVGPEEDCNISPTPKGINNPDGLDTDPTAHITVMSSEVGEGQDKQSCGDSLYADSDVGRVVERSEDNDWVCICVSDKVARVAKEARENALADLTKVLHFLVVDETDFPYQKETNPWMVQLLDERLHEAFQDILDELECLEEVKRLPKRGHFHPHINSGMSNIIRKHIDDIGDFLIAEVRVMMLVKDFLSDMVSHEMGTIAWPPHGTKQETIATVNRHNRTCGGLSQRVLFFMNHVAQFFPQHTMSQSQKRDLGPSLRIDGIYAQKFVSLPLERWGGLDSLLDIHENDAVMYTLVACIYSFANNKVYANIDEDSMAGFEDIDLSDDESKIVKGIWLGERTAPGRGAYTALELPRCSDCEDPLSLRSHGRLAYGGPDDATKEFTVKHIHYSLPTGALRTIEVDDEDFYRLYRQKNGEAHREEAERSVTPASAQGTKLVCVGTERGDVNLFDFNRMMEFYHCEDFMGVFTQRLKPPRGNDSSWTYLVFEDGQAKWVARANVIKGPEHESWLAAN